MSTPQPQPDRVDESSAESFPASDPPSWEPLHSGAPSAHPVPVSREPDTRFVGSIPEIYDRFLGPILLEPFAADLASRLDLPPRARVLELACGTGRLTRHLRRRLAPGGHVTATDLQQPMLDLAQTLAGTGADVDWRRVDATSLPFPDASFDAVLCQFGVMFFPDRSEAAREALRVLRPGAAFLFNVWDSLDHNPLARVADATIARFFPADPPEFYRILHGFFDAGALEALMVGSGFRDVVIETVGFTAESPSIQGAAAGLVRGKPVFNDLVKRPPADVPAIESAVQEAIGRELGNQGSGLRVPMRAKVVSGRRP